MLEVVLLVIISKLVSMGLNVFFPFKHLINLGLNGYVIVDDGKSREESIEDYKEELINMEKSKRTKKILKILGSAILSFVPIVNIVLSINVYFKKKREILEINDDNKLFKKLSDEDVGKIKAAKGILSKSFIISTFTVKDADLSVVGVIDGKPLFFRENNIKLDDCLKSKYTYNEVNELKDSFNGYSLFTLIDDEYRAILSAIDLTTTKTVDINDKIHDLDVLSLDDAKNKSYVVYPWSSMIRGNEEFEKCLDSINHKHKVIDEVLAESSLVDDETEDYILSHK